MPVSRYFTTACTVRTPSPDAVDSDVDADGVPAVTVDEVETFCHLQPYNPSGADEAIMGRSEAQRARRAWFPAATDITWASTVDIAGDRFDVHGDPASWLLGSGNDHLACLLVRQLDNSTGLGGSS